MEKAKAAELKVLTEARELEKHTLIITGNEKRFPKKYRVTLCARMQSEASDIVSGITEANDYMLNNKDERPLRFTAQRSAMRNCRNLINHIELAYKMRFIDSASFSHWSKMTDTVRNMLAAWYKSDRNRADNADAENSPHNTPGGKP
jgi:hypothetical protein